MDSSQVYVLTIGFLMVSLSFLCFAFSLGVFNPLIEEYKRKQRIKRMLKQAEIIVQSYKAYYKE